MTDEEIKALSISINLMDLTEDKIAEAMPHIGACRYDAPCIIGTLIPVKYREGLEGRGILNMCSEGLIEMPREQWSLAHKLQSSFDGALGNKAYFDRCLQELHTYQEAH